MQRAKSQRRGSRLSTVSSKRGMEFAKKVVIITGLIFVLSFLIIRGDMKAGYDTSTYATQLIVTTGGIFGASIIFYLNKAKVENLSKGKIRFTLLKLRLELKLKDKIPEEHYNTILYEIDKIDNMLDAKLDGALEEAIHKEIELQNY